MSAVFNLDRFTLEDTFRLAAEVRERSGSEVSVRASGSAIGRWDPRRLERVVTNLLSHALKFGAEKPIVISIDGGAEGLVRLQVCDQGIGISVQEQSRIFERFQRAVSSRHYSGFGLGLWYARQVVEAHGGTIGVRSEPAPAPRSRSTCRDRGRLSRLLWACPATSSDSRTSLRTRRHPVAATRARPRRRRHAEPHDALVGPDAIGVRLAGERAPAVHHVAVVRPAGHVVFAGKRHGAGHGELRRVEVTSAAAEGVDEEKRHEEEREANHLPHERWTALAQRYS